MNERIRDLIESTDPDIYDKLEGNTLDEFLKKFAELIIQECVHEIVDKGKDWMDFAPSQIGIRPEYWDLSQHIKTHFGVEE